MIRTLLLVYLIGLLPAFGFMLAEMGETAGNPKFSDFVGKKRLIGVTLAALLLALAWPITVGLALGSRK